MSFSSNDTIKKITKVIPSSINNQTVPKDLLVIIDEYIPKLNDENIHEVVAEYLSNDKYLKQQVIKNYGKISNWDVSQVTDMSNMFNCAILFNQPLNNWDVSKVTDMRGMFLRAKNFNQPLDNWNVSNVTNMRCMFYDTYFNQPLNNWDVSNVTDMDYMFYCATKFNQPLNNWDVSSVTEMYRTFYMTRNFNIQENAPWYDESWYDESNDGSDNESDY